MQWRLIVFQPRIVKYSSLHYRTPIVKVFYPNNPIRFWLMKFIKMTDQYMALQMRECKINRSLNVWSEIRPYKN